MPKNSGLLAIAILLTTTALFTVFKTHQKRLDQPSLAANAAQSNAASDPFGLADDRPPFSRHIRESQIDQFGSTERGRLILCANIGEQGHGIDNESFNATEIAMMSWNTVNDTCLEALVARLDDAVQERQKAIRSKQAPKKLDEFTITILRQHPREVSRVLKMRFNLGTGNPNFSVLPILEILQQHDSCDDIASSVASMRSRKDPLVFLFSDVRKKLCSAR